MDKKQNKEEISDLASQADAFLTAERNGLKLAIKGRFVALAMLSVWFIASRPWETLWRVELVFIALALLGLAHYILIEKRRDGEWAKYLFITLDMAIVIGVIVQASPSISVDLPQVLIYRDTVFPYLFVLLAIAAFGFSPGLMLWTGVVGAFGWLAGLAWIAGGMERWLTWGDIPPEHTAESFMAILLDPDFIGIGSRVQEAVIFFTVAVLLAFVMSYFRGAVWRRIEADQEREAVAGLFSQFVPDSVVKSLIADRGLLDPVQREATVLIADLVGFTQLTEQLGPERIFQVLGSYFDAAAEIIGRYQGVVIQFQGDAILATFNLPLNDADHARNALSAAQDILTMTETSEFNGEKLGLRIGLATGMVMAGDVGGGQRRTYTVHGDTVNLAARLEVLNKEKGTRVLFTQTTAAAAGADFTWQSMGEVSIRGQSAPVKLATLEIYQTS